MVQNNTHTHARTHGISPVKFLAKNTTNSSSTYGTHGTAHEEAESSVSIEDPNQCWIFEHQSRALFGGML